jgi:1-deoxy-D-xylulose-5-phosphate reductoisomerase
MPTVFNAANEVAVEAFLEERISFLEIESLIETTLQEHQVISHPDLETIRGIDQETRRLVKMNIQG